MKKTIILALSSILLLGAVACDNARTSANAPNSTENAGEVPATNTVENDQDDATSQVRKDQLNSDIRAREDRNNMTGGDANRADGDLASEVRSKLEANIPNSQLAVTAQNGAVAVSGTVQNQTQLAKIEPLARQIKGVQAVDVVVTVAPATPTQN